MRHDHNEAMNTVCLSALLLFTLRYCTVVISIDVCEARVERIFTGACHCCTMHTLCSA